MVVVVGVASWEAGEIGAERPPVEISRDLHTPTGAVVELVTAVRVGGWEGGRVGVNMNTRTHCIHGTNAV